MKYSPISPRLDFLISLLTQGQPLLDIGCDHGYLAIRALQKNITHQAYFIDPSELSLHKAQIHAREYLLDDKLSRCVFLNIPGQQIPMEYLHGNIVMAGFGWRQMQPILERILSTIPDPMNIEQQISQNKKINLILSPHSEEKKSEEFLISKKLNYKKMTIQEKQKNRIIFQINLI